MNLVYDFSGRQLEDRKNVLAKLKVMYALNIGLNRQ